MLPRMQALAVAASNVNLRSLFISVLVFFFISSTAIFISAPSTSFQPYIPSSIPKINLPDLHDVPGISKIFGPGAHSPPSTNSTASSETWYSSWSWLNPFSSADAQEEERVALPNLPKRCPVYTYHDPKVDFDQNLNDDLLLVWRRAWWAQGFEPIILGPVDALKNDLAQKVLHQKHSPRLRYEIMRFLAWGFMEGGVFADYRAVPIGSYNDTALASFRRCDFPYLTRYTNQTGYIYSGSILNIMALLQSITDQNDTITSLEEATPVPGPDTDPMTSTNLWRIEPEIPSLAVYSPATIEKLYNNVASNNLSSLINAHVHSHFLEQFPGGVDVLHPFKDPTSTLMHSTLELAKKITTCPESPWPYSCPPNREKCKTCTATSSPTTSVIESLANTTGSGSILPSNKLTLANIPHPYTLIAILNRNQSVFKSKGEDELDPDYIRGYTKQNLWVTEVTSALLGPIYPAANRSITLKKAIADEKEAHRGLWTASEIGWEIKEVEWQLGFALPPVKLEQSVKEEDLDLINRAHKFVTKNSGKGNAGKLMKPVEAWNMGDTEVWKFVRAFVQRRDMERNNWVEMEKKWGKGLGDEKRKGWW